MHELSVFVDESGNMGEDSRYYLLTLLFHDQSDNISGIVASYERSLANRELKDIPMHFAPLIRGNGPYEGLDTPGRNGLLMSFTVFCSIAPVRYTTFLYRKDQFEDAAALRVKMKRDLIAFLFEHLAWLQGYDRIKIYYDDGQRIITHVLHHAFEYAVSKQTIMYKEASPTDYRLAQMADFICGVELAAAKYRTGEIGPSETRFLGQWSDFKRTFLRKIRKKAM